MVFNDLLSLKHLSIMSIILTLISLLRHMWTDSAGKLLKSVIESEIRFRLGASQHNIHKMMQKVIEMLGSSVTSILVLKH